MHEDRRAWMIKMSEEMSPLTAGWVNVTETERRCFKNYTEVCKSNLSGGKRNSKNFF